MISRLHDKFKLFCHQQQATREHNQAARRLHAAVKSKRLDSVIKIVNKFGNDPAIMNAQLRVWFNGRYFAGPTPLIVAAKLGDIKILHALLNAPAININAVDDEKLIAPPRQHASLEPDIRDFQHVTALHTALLAKQFDVVCELAKRNDLDINAQTRSGKSALILAMIYCPPAVSILLQIKDQDVNRKDSEGKTALHWACSHPNYVCPTVPYYLGNLISHQELDINAQDKNGNTPLM